MIAAALTLFQGVGTFVFRNWRMVLLASLASLLALQTARLHHAKGDLATARADLIDPATKRKWSEEAQERARDLNTCHGNVQNLQTSLDHERDAVKALQADGDARARAVDEAAQAARSARAAAETWRQRAAGAHVTGDGSCPAAQSIFDEVLK